MSARSLLPVLVLLVLAASADAAVRLFLLSGQSNMKGLDPAVSFTPAVEAAYPDDECIVVHHARSGQQIRRWIEDWQPPPGITPNRMYGNGQLYAELVAMAKTQLEGKPAPVSIAFCWHQGEADSKAGYAQTYEASLRQVYASLQRDFARQDIAFVIARISDHGVDLTDKRPDWNAIRAIHVAIAESLPLAAWVDTDDLNGPKDGLHYPKEGYAELGRRLAAACVELLATGEP